MISIGHKIDICRSLRSSFPKVLVTRQLAVPMSETEFVLHTLHFLQLVIAESNVLSVSIEMGINDELLLQFKHCLL